MELTPEEKETQKQAIKYLKEHEDEFTRYFVDFKFPIRLGLATLFMAGSPGAGKTEFSKRIQTTYNSAIRKDFPGLNSPGAPIGTSCCRPTP